MFGRGGFPMRGPGRGMPPGPRMLGHRMPGRGMPGPGMPGPGMPGLGMPGRGMPGRGMPGRGMPGRGMPSRGMPGRGMPGPRARGPGAMSPGPRKVIIQPRTHRFLVPEDICSKIVGPDNQNVKKILSAMREKEPSSKLNIYKQKSNGQEIMEGASDRVITIEANAGALAIALHHVIPILQAAVDKKGKLEVRMVVPSPAAPSIIGQGGVTVKRIKETLGSFIQIYTLPLPMSEETCIRLLNANLENLVKTCLEISKALSTTKSNVPVVMYDPIWFEQGFFGDTGSFIDSARYQEAIKSGSIKMKPYRGQPESMSLNLGGVCDWGSGEGGMEHWAQGAPKGKPKGYYEEEELEDIGGTVGDSAVEGNSVVGVFK